jgi:hypothetical protein
VLATIRLRDEKDYRRIEGSYLTETGAVHIDDTSDRQFLYSSAMLQMMALCECEKGTRDGIDYENLPFDYVPPPVEPA